MSGHHEEPGPGQGARARGSDQTVLPLRFEEMLGAAALALIFLISFANVVVRYLTDVSFAFTEEVSVFLLVVLTFVGSASAVAKDKHIRMTALAERLSPRLRQSVEVLVLLLAVGIFALVIRYGATLAWDDYRFGMSSPGLGVPQWLYSIWVPLLSVLIVVRLLERIWIVLRRGVR